MERNFRFPTNYSKNGLDGGIDGSVSAAVVKIAKSPTAALTAASMVTYLPPGCPRIRNIKIAGIGVPDEKNDQQRLIPPRKEVE